MVLKSQFDDFSYKQLIVLDNALFYDWKYTVIFIIYKQNVLRFWDFLGFSSSAIDIYVLFELWYRITEWWMFDVSIKHIDLIVNLVPLSIKQSHTSGLKFFWDEMSYQWVVGVRYFESVCWSHPEGRLSTKNGHCALKYKAVTPHESPSDSAPHPRRT